MAKQKSIGIEVTLPKKKCEDKHCPFHGELKIRGRIFKGKVRNVFHKTAVIEWVRFHYLPKYERYEKRRSRLKVHVPDCIEVKKGDVVKAVESRKISKTKNSVVVEVIK